MKSSSSAGLAIEQTPLLGSFGEPGNLEWTQYLLGDDNQPIDASRGARWPTCGSR